MKEFLVGMSKQDITPPLGCLLYGYPSIRHGQAVLDPLSVGVTAIKQEEKTLLLIGAELCYLGAETSAAVRKMVSNTMGIPYTDILCFTTHTHSGPVTHTSAGWGKADEAYINEILIPKTIEAAKLAISSMQAAVMGVGIVHSQAGINRRQVTENGVILGQNPDGPYDPSMTVIRFQTPEGVPICSIIHFAVHPTAAGANHVISRDWPGYMVDRIEEISGAGCMYINGAEGDIGPRLSNGKTTGDDSYIAEIGKIAQADAQKAYESVTKFFVPDLHILTGEVFLPYAEPPALKAVEENMLAMGDPAKLIEVDIKKYAQLQEMKRMYESGEAFPAGTTLEQTVVALGEYAMVPAPFEAFCEISLAIGQGSPYKKTLFLGMANGGYGYLPTHEQLPLGGYEVDSFRAAGITGFREDTAQIFIDANIDLLQQLNQIQKGFAI